MNKIAVENEAMEIIGEQVAAGYYSGMFELRNDETEKYVTVYWDINIDIVEND